jgi:hypothetical protein
MFKMQTKRYKVYAKMEDKILPVVDRLLDLYPLMEPFVDRALKVAENMAPLVLKKLDENMELVAGGFMDAINYSVFSEDTNRLLNLHTACGTLTNFSTQLEGITDPARKKEVYNKIVKDINEGARLTVAGTALRDYLLIQAKDLYEKAIE